MPIQINSIELGTCATQDTYDLPYVQSVQPGTNVTINNTDPRNPIVNSTGSGGGGVVDSVVAGTGISVNNTDPANPIVSATGGGSVSAVSVTDSTGITASVANPTTTPDITIGLSASGVTAGTYGDGTDACVVTVDSTGRITAISTDPISGGSAFSWPAIFTVYGATAGGAYDFTSISTLFKDTAGTIPVTASGDAIALIKDRSGLGHDFSQATSGNRPTYYIDQAGAGCGYFNSANNNYMDGSGLNCSALTAWQAFIYKSAAGGRILDTRGTGTLGTVQGWVMAAGDGGGTDLMTIDDGAGNYLADDPQTFLAQNASIAISIYTLGNATIYSKVITIGGNGTIYAGTNALKGVTLGSSTSSATCRMGGPSNTTGSQMLNGYLYACGCIGAMLSATDRNSINTYLRDIAFSP